MLRRDFLKLSGFFSAALLAGLAPAANIAALPVEAELAGKLYRGTRDGLIYVSEDDGRSWSLHTRFGSHLSVGHVYVDLRGRLAVMLICEGYDFRVTLSPDSRTWRTA